MGKYWNLTGATFKETIRCSPSWEYRIWCNFAYCFVSCKPRPVRL